MSSQDLVKYMVVAVQRFLTVEPSTEELPGRVINGDMKMDFFWYHGAVVQGVCGQLW